MKNWFDGGGQATRTALDLRQRVLDRNTFQRDQLRLQGPGLFVALAEDLMSTIDRINRRFPATNELVSYCFLNPSNDALEFGRKTFPSVDVSLLANFESGILKCTISTRETIFSPQNQGCIEYQLKSDGYGKLGFFSTDMVPREEIVEMLTAPVFKL